MYVRLAFAVAAHLEPEILVIDEVLAVGDIEFQKKCLGKMSEVANDGRTVLLVTHNMIALRALCSRALLLDSGRLVFEGDANVAADRNLRRAAQSHGAVAWDSPERAPGNEYVRLRSVSVFCDYMEPGKVDIQRAFTVCIEYWVMQEKIRLLVGFHLMNAKGEPVLASANMRSASSTVDSWAERRFPAGLYRTSCQFPGRLFNYGEYTIDVVINDASSDRHHVMEREAIRFEIVDTGYMREEFQGLWIGSIRIKLPWHTEKIPSDDAAAGPQSVEVGYALPDP
jgi:lipopolysaccharide transport system ATP-binding protein